MGTWKRVITSNDDSNYKNSSLVAGDLPIATTGAIGGIQVGTNLSVTAGGVLSASSGSNTTNSSMAFNTGTGVVTLTDSASGTVTVDIDGRYIQSSSVDIQGDTNSQTIDTINGLSIEGGTGISTESDENALIITNTSANVSTNLTYTASAIAGKVNSSDGTNATLPLADGTNAGLMTSAQKSAITANTLKQTNVSTNLGITGTTSTRTITSSDGTNATIPVASTSASGVMSTTIFDQHVVNNAKTSASGITSCTETNVKSILAAFDSTDTLHIGDGDNDATIAIRGNLTVSGSTTTVNTEEIKLADNTIELNSNYSGSSASENAGISINRDSTTGGDPSLIWAENVDRWMIDYNSKKADIASVNTSSSATPTTEDSMGVGSFWLRTGADELYVRTS